MARRRRRKNQDDGSTYLILAAIVLLIVLTPIILLFGVVYFGKKNKDNLEYIEGDMSDFWLDDDEKSEYTETAKVLSKADKAIKKAEATGNVKKVSKNKDGRFSARSKLGKELRATIEDNEMLIHQYSDDYHHLVNLPRNRWEDFRNTYLAAKGFKVGLFFWIILAAIVPFFLMPEYFLGMEIFFKFPIMVFDGRTMPENTWMMMLIVTGIPVVLGGLQALLSLFSVEKITPYPPKVTAENIDRY